MRKTPAGSLGETQGLRRVLLSLLTLGMGTLFALVLAELGLRIYHRFQPLIIFYDDSYKRFRGRPFAQDWDSHLNSLGYKDQEFGKRDPSTYRILGIGDSFAFGVVPYRYNYLTLLETALQTTNSKTEILNMGIPGIGPQDYLSLLVREGLALQPDMVLLSFFVGNDFDQSRVASQPRRWHTYSYVASLLRYFLRIRPSVEGQIIHPGSHYCDDCPTFGAERYLALEKGRSHIYFRGEPGFAPLLEDSVHFLREIQQLCRERHIELVVVLIPDEVQVNGLLQGQVRSLFPEDKQKAWNTAYPNEQLGARLNGLGIAWIDLYPVFADRGRTEQLYRVRDSHWNIAGNKLAADTLFGFLGKRLPKAR